MKVFNLRAFGVFTDDQLVILSKKLKNQFNFRGQKVILGRTAENSDQTVSFVVKTAKKVGLDFDFKQI